MSSSTVDAAASPGVPRMESLTGLRFAAAAAVFLSHVGPTAYFANQGVNDALFRVFMHAGGAGVSFFFILSGFVLTVAHRPEDTPRAFLRRRLVKVFPNHLVTFVAAAFLFSYAVTWERALPNFFLVHAWVPEVETFFGMNPVAWSLSSELLFYLIFPFAIPFLCRIRPDHLWGWAVATVLAVFAVALVAHLVVPATPALSFPPLPVGLYQYWFVYILPVSRLFEFFLGVLVARIVLTGRWINIGMLSAGFLVLPGFVLADQAPALLSLSALLVAPLALLVGAAGWTDLVGGRSWWRSRPWVWLGETSFAFYLVHGLVLFGTRPFLGVQTFFDAPTAIGLVIVGFVVSLVLARLLYVFVERPLVRRFSRPRPPAPPAPWPPDVAPGTAKPGHA